ncbi:S24 family peptidase [Paenibacillus sp. UMB4589-SE434]|uniref:helix-turn-helix domain-containing protein n=1 Tax=Paenibacillus sp. UMB4589-SE434 TaxID=3046314 RepID=UPI002550E421|nr:S24 family peptidase [Paenibacillus sp. UMB4589-SE434]MDK8182067.1 S24 family peptidase [Paenibacillus sp. UMB4589-SE434]
MNEIKIGDLIKDARITNGYKTKKEFADVTGVSPATLSRIENNTQAPTPETLIKISKHLNNITYGDLMKAANYFEGIDPEHEKFLVGLLNENEELDNKILDMLDTCLMFMSVDSSLHKKLVNLVNVSDDYYDLYEDADNAEIKYLYIQNDFDIDTKKRISDDLNNLILKFSPKLKEYFNKNREIKPVPLIGSICAGNGLIPNEDIEEYINFPFLNNQQPDYALRVRGDSMKNAGIEHGDVVFLRKASWVEFNGQIVAVIVNGEEGSLKRLTWSEGSAQFTLKPENDSYQSVEVSPNEMTICGLYAGHYRPAFSK